MNVLKFGDLSSQGPVNQSRPLGFFANFTCAASPWTEIPTYLISFSSAILDRNISNPWGHKQH